MYENFTEQAKQVMKTAEEISEQLGHNYMGTEHILIGLLAVAFVIWYFKEPQWWK